MAKKKILYDFDTLFQLSPNGLIIFNKKRIISVNNSLLDILKINKLKETDIENKTLIEKESWDRIKKWIHFNSDIDNSSFKDHIIIINRLGERIEKYLVINKLMGNSENIQFIGLLLPPLQVETSVVSYQLINDRSNLLNRENVAINDLGEQKISQAVKMRTFNGSVQVNSFFTKRENEVLRLSIEGLPIKIIADRLSISSRTVEKYRTKLMEKSGAKNIVEAIVFSIKNNLIEI